jgi:hypothetical protein
MTVMRALSLTQPWATIVARGLKPIENRRWTPPIAMYGETFAIHASKTWDKEGELWIRETWEGFDDVVDAIGDAVLVRSAILGVARLTGYMSKSDRLFYTAAGGRIVASPGHELESNPWYVGPYGFTLDQVRELNVPIPVSGALSFWRLPVEVDAILRLQLEAP